MPDHPSNNAAVSDVDTAAVRELLGTMKATFGTLDQAFKTLNEQSSQVATLGPSADAATSRMAALRRQIKAQESEQNDRVAGIKRTIKDELTLKAKQAMKDQIREQIRIEIIKQTAEQVDAQIPEHIPISLSRAQTGESTRYIAEVQHALQNSEARRKNSVMRPTPSNMSDPLAVVLRPDGSESTYYPANLTSLFAYDHGKVKALLQDYELHDHGVLENNLNRFMAHVGIRFELVPVKHNAKASPGAA